MGAVLADDWIMAVARAVPRMADLCLAALVDTQAEAVLCDYLEENDLMNSPFEVGKSYIICQNTLYYVGRVVEIGFGWVKLVDASWVHWTGKLGTLLRRQSFDHKDWPSGHRKPRTERCGESGEVTIWTANTSSNYPWYGGLPKESIS